MLLREFFGFCSTPYISQKKRNTWQVWAISFSLSYYFSGMFRTGTQCFREYIGFLSGIYRGTQSAFIVLSGIYRELRQPFGNISDPPVLIPLYNYACTIFREYQGGVSGRFRAILLLVPYPCVVSLLTLLAFIGTLPVRRFFIDTPCFLLNLLTFCISVHSNSPLSIIINSITIYHLYPPIYFSSLTFIPLISHI